MKSYLGALYVGAMIVGLAAGWLFVPKRPQSPTADEDPKVFAIVPANRQNTPESGAETLLVNLQSNPRDAERWAYHIPQEDIPGAILELTKQDRAHSGVLRVLFERWSQFDPEAAFHSALKFPDPGITNLYRFGPSSMGVRTEQPLYDILRMVATNWMDADPEEAIASILALTKEHKNRNGLLRGVLPDYARSRPGTAVRLAFDELDPRGGLDTGTHSTDGDTTWLASIFTRWGESDPQAAIGRAERIEDRSLRAGAMKGIFEGWHDREPDAARRWAVSLCEGERTHPLWGALLEAIGETDPLAAMELHQAQHLQGGAILSKLARQWAGEDVVEMIRSAHDTTDPRLRWFLPTYGFELMSETRSGAEMASLAMELPRDVQQQAVGMIAARWSAQDSAAAEAWGLQLEDAVLRRVFMKAHYEGQLKRAPMEAASSLSRIEDEWLRQSLAIELAKSWSGANPLLAAAWLDQFPEGLLPATVLEAHRLVGAEWVKRSRLDALQWFAARENAEERQAILQGFAQSLSEADSRQLLVELGRVEEASEKDRELLREWVADKSITSQRSR